jgi:hypothetical protein
VAYTDEDSRNLGGSVAGILGFVAAFGISRFIGASFWIPVAFSGLALFAFTKTRPQSDQALRIAASLLAGQALWMVLGIVFQPQLLANVALDIVFSSVVFFWLLLRPNFWAIGVLVIYELFSLAVNVGLALQLDVQAIEFGPIIIHILMRVGILIASVLAVFSMRRGPRVEDATLQDVFE